MQRKVSVLAFVLGFTGVMAIASGWSGPAVSRGDPVTYAGATSSRTVVEPARSHLFVINVTLYADGLPGNPQDSTFGTVRADGYRCGVNCDDNP